MGDVIRIDGITVVDEAPLVLLEMAKRWGMEHCIIVGYDSDGILAFGGTTSDHEKIIALLQRGLHWTMREIDDHGGGHGAA